MKLTSEFNSSVKFTTEPDKEVIDATSSFRRFVTISSYLNAPKNSF